MSRRIDYHKKKFRNPFFSNKINKSYSRLFVGCLVVAIFFVIYFFVVHFDNKISQIEVTGAHILNQNEILQIANDQLSEKRFLVFDQSRVLFFNKNELKKRIFEALPVQQVIVKKKYPEGLFINVTEKEVSLVWVSNNKKYFIDNNGVAILQLIVNQQAMDLTSSTTAIIRSENLNDDYPTVIDPENRAVAIGQQIISKESASFITLLNKQTNKQGDINIDYYLLNKSANYVTAHCTDGWEGYFSLSQPVDLQVKELSLILQKEVYNRKNLKYIDFRYGDKVFYQ